MAEVGFEPLTSRSGVRRSSPCSTFIRNAMNAEQIGFNIEACILEGLHPKDRFFFCNLISQGHNFHKLLFSTFQKYYILDDGGKVSVLR